MKCAIILQGLQAVENQLIVFMPVFKKMMDEMENNEDVQQILLKYLDSLQLESKVDKVINDSKKLTSSDVFAVLD